MPLREKILNGPGYAGRAGYLGSEIVIHGQLAGDDELEAHVKRD